jgi:hypothetical protein
MHQLYSDFREWLFLKNILKISYKMPDGFVVTIYPEVKENHTFDFPNVMDNEEIVFTGFNIKFSVDRLGVIGEKEYAYLNAPPIITHSIESFINREVLARLKIPTEVKEASIKRLEGLLTVKSFTGNCQFPSITLLCYGTDDEIATILSKEAVIAGIKEINVVIGYSPDTPILSVYDAYYGEEDDMLDVYNLVENVFVQAHKSDLFGYIINQIKGADGESYDLSVFYDWVKERDSSGELLHLSKYTVSDYIIS